MNCIARSLRSLVLIATCATVSLLASARSASAQPPSEPCIGTMPTNAVRLFANSGWTGECVQYRLKVYPHYGISNLGSFNDRPRSAQVGNQVRLRIFTDAGFVSESFTHFVEVLEGDQFQLVLGSIGSSIRLETRDVTKTCFPIPNGMVAIWSNQLIGTTTGDCYMMQVTKAGQFFDIGQGMQNDSMTALFNNSDRQVTFYDNAAGNGQSYTVAPHTGTNNVGDSFNDKATSMTSQ
jgi:hypothetical protein